MLQGNSRATASDQESELAGVRPTSFPGSSREEERWPYERGLGYSDILFFSDDRDK